MSRDATRSVATEGSVRVSIGVRREWSGRSVGWSDRCAAGTAIQRRHRALGIGDDDGRGAPVGATWPCPAHRDGSLPASRPRANVATRVVPSPLRINATGTPRVAWHRRLIRPVPRHRCTSGRALRAVRPVAGRFIVGGTAKPLDVVRNCIHLCRRTRQLPHSPVLVGECP